MKVSLSHENFDQTDNSARLDVLNLPHVEVEKVYVNDHRLSEDEYTMSGEKISVTAPKLTENDDLHVYLNIKTRRILTERYVAIIVALIGVFGTIVGGLLQTPWFGELIGVEKSSPSFAIFEADHYGVDHHSKTFKAVMRWEKPGEQNYSFPVDVPTTHYGYAFVRIRGTNDNLREATIGSLTGPVELRNGTSWEVPISEGLLKEYSERNVWLQLVVFALPKNVPPAEGQPLSKYDDLVKILISPAVRPRP